MEHLLKIFFCAHVGKCAPLVGIFCFPTIILAVYALFPTFNVLRGTVPKADKYRFLVATCPCYPTASTRSDV